MKKLKKVCIIAAVFSLAACCSAGAAACNEGEHVHSWGDWTTVTAATCTETGLKERVCKDDPEHKEQAVIEPLSHDYGEWTEVSEADCTHAKTEERVCSHNAAHKQTRTVGEALGHDWGDWTQKTPASCNAAEEEERVCGNDEKHTETRTVGAALGHGWGEWLVTAPTATGKGSAARVCGHDGCDEKQVVELPALTDKNYKTENCTATCEEAGEALYKIKVGDSDIGFTAAAPALGHGWGDWTEKTPATCTQAKVEERVCSHNANHTQTRTTGVAKNHDWDEWTVNNAATCDTDGEKQRVCKNDSSHVETEILEKTNHAWSKWTEKTPATCTQAKVEERVCGNDKKHTETRTAGEALGHSWDDVKVTVQADCSGKGEKTYTCSGCGKTKTEETDINPDLHDWDDGAVTTPATELAPGVKTYTCTDCGKTRTEDIPVLSHTHKYGGEWKSDVNNHWKECTDAHCSEKTDVAAHGWDDGEVTTLPVCTENGVKTFTCSVCGEAKTESVPKLKHDWEEWQLTAPTAEEEGAAERTCKREGCDEKQTKTLPVLTSPDYHKGEDSATCSAGGKATYSISVDGEEFSFDIDTPVKAHKTGHTDKVASTCNTVGYAEYWTCAECGKMFSDSACKTEISEPAELPLEKHTYVYPQSYHQQVNKTCTVAGVKTHYECTVCHAKFLQNFQYNANAKPIESEDELVIPAAHSISKVAKKNPTCTANGNIEHYRCTVTTCKKLFTDNGGVNETDADSVAVPALGHGNITHTEYVAPTCMAAGNKEYWTCGTCNYKFAEENCATRLTSVTITKLGHSYGEYEITLPTADATGMAVKTCTREGCDETVSQHAVKQPVPVLSAPEYALTNDTSTCTEDGTADYTIKLRNADIVTFNTVSFKGHKWYADITDAEDGKSNVVKTCSLCGATDGAVYKVDFTEDISGAANKALDRANYYFASDAGVKTVVLVFDAEGSYTLNFANMASVPVNLTGIKVGTANALTNESVDSAFVNMLETEFIGETNRREISTVKFTIDADNVGKDATLTFKFTNDGASFVLSTAMPEAAAKTLGYGDNTVIVTEADAMFKDLYEFVPAETKIYSITVPAAVEVLKDNLDLITPDGKRTVNFEAEAGKKIVFAFKYNKVACLTVNIGDEVVVLLPTLELGVALDVDMVGQTAIGIKFADGIPEGKYKLVFEGAFLNSRMLGCGNFWFKVNGADTYDSFTNASSIYMSAGASGTKNGWVYSVTRTEWSITIDYCKGDIIYLGITSANIKATDNLGAVTITATAV